MMQLSLDLNYDNEPQQLTLEDYENQLIIEKVWGRIKYICSVDLKDLNKIADNVCFFHKSVEDSYYLDKFRELTKHNLEYVVNYIKNYLR